MTAVIEAIFGQLYLITVVALVVQNLGQTRRMGRGWKRSWMKRRRRAAQPAGVDVRERSRRRALRRARPERWPGGGPSAPERG